MKLDIRCKEEIDDVLAYSKRLEDTIERLNVFIVNIRKDTDKLTENWKDDSYRAFSEEVAKIEQKAKDLSSKLQTTQCDIKRTCNSIICE